MRHGYQIISLVVVTLLGICPAKSQYSTNYQTNIISGVISNWPGDYVVGSNTFGNALLVRNGGLLANANGYAGYLPASSSNLVMVVDSGSVWSNANLYLAYSGAGNSLLISNAGRVANSLGTYVGFNAGSSGNRVLVTGTNSVWDCANSLSLGFSGFGNSLVISNGGRVNDSYSELGNNSSGSYNSVLVTGAGSVWNNASSCTIGRNGGKNNVTVSKGGRLYSDYATIGMFDTANSNLVVVTDSGSLWDNSAVASDINVGTMGSGNSLIVTNGGQVLGYYVFLGRNGSGQNSVLVSDPGSSFSLNCHYYFNGHDNTFTAANGATIEDKFCYINHGAGSSNNSVLITGPNTSWSNSYSVFVGFSGGNGSLTISNGAAMRYINTFWTMDHSSVLGYESTSSNNCALVTGNGSVWDCSGDMFAGLNGPANSLVITNGGRVISENGYLGSNPGSDRNRGLVTGNNSVWTNSSDLYVGYFTAGNNLVISNGGQVVNNYGYVGRVAGSDNNRVLVVGTNSVWTNQSNVFVGFNGGGNSLTISNGGRVSDGWGMVGYGSNSFNNQVLVTGPGSIWRNAATVFIGDFGPGNGLVISNGARVSDDIGVMGYDANSFNNQALVTGAGSVWSNVTAVFVGNFGSSNNLAIRDGGVVTDYWGLVGEETASTDNRVYVESGGVWRNEELFVGDWGSHNALFVNGGSVFANSYLVVGYDPPYCDNLAQVDSGQVIVTNQTAAAVLEVYGGEFRLNGGTVIADNLIITNECARFFRLGGTLMYKNLILTPAFDADGDGIPNGWEQSHGLNPLDPFDAESDSDNDGMSNWQEYLAGTNPTNNASCLRISSLLVTNGDALVGWTGIGGRTYALQTNAAACTNFTDCGMTITIPGTGEVLTNFLELGGASNAPARNYRIRLVP